MIPQAIQDTGERAIASYSYTDIAEGTGVVEFLGYRDSVSGSSVVHLTTNAIASDVVESNAVSWAFNLTPFNMPKVIQGTAIIRLSAYQTGPSGSSNFFTITISKISGGVETILGRDYSVTTTGGAGVGVTYSHCLPISLVKTNFKRGDSLRVNVEKNSVQTITIGHDPINRNGTLISDSSVYPTKFQALIPFKIDL